MMLPCGCPEQFPDWDGQDITLDGHPAHVMPIACFLHMPLAYETYRQRQHTEITQLDLAERWPGFALTRTGFLRGQMICLLDGGYSAARRIENLPAPFQIRALLHHGGIGTIRNSVRALQNRLFDMGRMPKEMYLGYLTCPACAEARGGEKILLVRRWVNSKRLADRLSR